MLVIVMMMSWEALTSWKYETFGGGFVLGLPVLVLHNGILLEYHLVSDCALH